ncbi:HIT family protein [Streptococcus pantholopis]|uniref:Histidine triad protein n=1 Tax=Streptococcus pantholopis TaxID=1811193 RepID=A0A172Q8M1_9STRE|nr:HIT family protein [Streptococcus pantholopis]AND79843.1 histidine triad protein [Streptococcus pantholopis]
MENCLFCKIAEGQIPSAKVYEDEHTLAFLDISQTTKGHMLLIPKKHVRNTLEMDEGLAQTVFARLPKLARALQKATKAGGMNIINNNEEIAGQTVFHAHIHLIPRYSTDDGLEIHFTAHDSDSSALNSLADDIRSEVGQ